MSDFSLDQADINFVSNLAVEAGRMALDMRQRIQVSEKAPGDYVTDADQAVSRLIVSSLCRRMPGDLIVSEEGDRQQARSHRTWLVDPIDGTDHYMRNSRQFSVMIGLLVDGEPAYGWVYQPTEEILYFGGPGSGTFMQKINCDPAAVVVSERLDQQKVKRIIIGRRDSRNRPWLANMNDLRLFQVGSMGIKVIFVLEDRADMVAQLHGRMNVWDSAGPAAIALGAGLEVGSGPELAPHLPYPDVFDESTFRQQFPIVIGRPGTLAWAREFLMKEHGEDSPK
jgi:3'(2'), 5'-bisphosphate nucleotidase